MLSLLAGIVFLSNQTAMPRQQSVRAYDAGQAQKVFATDRFSFHGQSATLVIIEARASAQLLFEHADFGLEVFDEDLLVAVHPSGTADQQEGKGIHEAIILSPDHGDQHFVAEPPLWLGHKDSHSKSLSLVRLFGQYGMSNKREMRMEHK